MWWVKYGFKENPLDIRPSNLLVGIEQQENELKDAIFNGEIVLLYGPFGSGKTSLALKVMRDLSEKFDFIYINGELDKDIDIKTLVFRKYYKKLLVFKLKTKKRIVLIVDEMQFLQENFFEKIKALYDIKVIYAVVLIQISKEITNVTPSFKNRISRYIELRYPSVDDLIKAVKLRLKDKVEIDYEVIKRIAKACGNNPRCVFIKLNEYFEKGALPKIGEMEEETVEEREASNIKVSEQQKQIIKALLLGKLTVKEISNVTGINYNTVSKQVSRLYQKGILEKVVEGRTTYYKIKDKYYNYFARILGK